MYLDRAILELQAGLLLPANFPRLAAEGIAAGHYGETLSAIASLVGEPRGHVLAVLQAIPDVEARILDELGATPRSSIEAAWTLTRSVASDTVQGEFDPRRGAEELTSLARATDDAGLLHETARLEGIIDQWEHIPSEERDRLVLEEARRLSSIQPD